MKNERIREIKPEFLTIALSVIAIVLLALFLHVNKTIKRPSKGLFQKRNEIPLFSIPDISGNVFNSNNLERVPTFIQFSNPHSSVDRELYQEVASSYGSRINVMVIFDRPGKDIDWPIIQGSYLIPDPNKIVFNLLEVPEISRYVFYDKNRQRKISGITWLARENGLKLLLKQNIDGKYFNVNEIIPPKGNLLSECPWLNILNLKIRSSPRNNVIVCFFSSICENCPSGYLINRLKAFHSTIAERVDVLCILSDNYSEGDISALRSQLSIEFIVEVADPNLGSKWDELMSEYGRNSVNGIVFLVDQTGRITYIFNNEKPLDQSFNECQALAMRE